MQAQSEAIEHGAAEQTQLLAEPTLVQANVAAKNQFLQDIMDNTGHGIVVFSKELVLTA